MIHLIFEMLLGHNESLTVTFFVWRGQKFFVFSFGEHFGLKKMSGKLLLMYNTKPSFMFTGPMKFVIVLIVKHLSDFQCNTGKKGKGGVFLVTQDCISHSGFLV